MKTTCGMKVYHHNDPALGTIVWNGSGVYAQKQDGDGLIITEKVTSGDAKSWNEQAHLVGLGTPFIVI